MEPFYFINNINT